MRKEQNGKLSQRGQELAVTRFHPRSPNPAFDFFALYSTPPPASPVPHYLLMHAGLQDTVSNALIGECWA